VEIKPDLYKHFKGGIYELLFLGLNEADLGLVAIYRHQGESQIWVRTIDKWNEEVEWPDGQKRARFTPLGEVP